MPYLRTEWGIEWNDEPGEVQPTASAFIAREIVNDFNRAAIEDNWEARARVVQRQISDWGDDE